MNAKIPLEPSNAITVAENAEGFQMLNFARSLVLLLLLTSLTAPAAEYAYVGNRNYTTLGRNAVMVVDTANNAIVQTIPMNAWPWRNTVNSALGVVYVTIFDGLPLRPGRVFVINGITNELSAIITGVGSNPSSPVVNSAGTRLYTANEDHTVSVIDTASNSVVATIPAVSTAMDINPAGTQLYIIQGQTSLRIFDTTSLTEVGTPIPLCGSAVDIAFKPSGDFVYVTCLAGQLLVINTATQQVVATIQITESDDSGVPQNVILHPSGAYAYVKTRGNANGQFVVVDTASMAVIARTQLPANSQAMAINTEGTRVYVTDNGGGGPAAHNPEVTVIDTVSYAVVATVPAPASPDGSDAAFDVAVLPTPPSLAFCPAGNVRTKPNSLYLQNSEQQVVTDNSTGLMWRKCSEGQAGSSCTGSASLLNWTQALTGAAASSFAGYTDWRLPNVKELASLIEPACYAPSINRSIFPATPSAAFWSSTTFAAAPGEAWKVEFNYAFNANYDDYKTESHYVRLVRGGMPLDNFDHQADSTPDAFGFSAQTNSALATVVTSNSITIAGLTTVTGIATTQAFNAQYSVNGGPFTATPGAISNGDTARVRLTSSASANTTRSATLTIGGVLGVFQVTTGTLPDPIFNGNFE